MIINQETHYELFCERCEYFWYSKEIPKTCASCRSKLWNKKREGKELDRFLRKKLERARMNYLIATHKIPT